MRPTHDTINRTACCTYMSLVKTIVASAKCRVIQSCRVMQVIDHLTVISCKIYILVSSDRSFGMSESIIFAGITCFLNVM